MIDRDFKVVVANSNFKAVFGDAVGKHCYEIYKGRDSVCEHCMAARTFEDGKIRVNDEDGIDKEGRPAHYVVHIAPVYDEVGEIPYVIEMSYDLTETKSLQREYNVLFERVPCYVAVINRELRVVRANSLLRETFGDCVGEHCYEVYKHRTTKCPDCPALKTFASGGSYQAEHVGIDKQGEPTHYVVSTCPLVEKRPRVESRDRDDGRRDRRSQALHGAGKAELLSEHPDREHARLAGGGRRCGCGEHLQPGRRVAVQGGLGSR